MGGLYGYRRSLPFLMGIANGFFLTMLACATLSSVLNAYLPVLEPTLKLLGTGYILWLAYGVYKSSSKLLEKETDTKPLRYWNGMALQLVNPKAAFFGLTVYAVFLTPILDEPLTFLWTPLVLATITFTAISTWALGGQVIHRWLGTPVRAKAFGTMLALALVYTALDLSGVLPW